LNGDDCAVNEDFKGDQLPEGTGLAGAGNEYQVIPEEPGRINHEGLTLQFSFEATNEEQEEWDGSAKSKGKGEVHQLSDDAFQDH
jgi:hypothetical protein